MRGEAPKLQMRIKRSLAGEKVSEDCIALELMRSSTAGVGNTEVTIDSCLNVCTVFCVGNYW